mmetsp:Transcript_16053/g.47652  ORF Transcript_16053/g.47652 Transcript_16053/m.47652 type:complete len:301 (-) Transcript_16053:154-1056(-)
MALYEARNFCAFSNTSAFHTSSSASASASAPPEASDAQLAVGTGAGSMAPSITPSRAASTRSSFSRVPSGSASSAACAFNASWKFLPSAVTRLPLFLISVDISSRAWQLMSTRVSRCEIRVCVCATIRVIISWSWFLASRASSRMTVVIRFSRRYRSRFCTASLWFMRPLMKSSLLTHAVRSSPCSTSDVDITQNKFKTSSVFEGLRFAALDSCTTRDGSSRMDWNSCLVILPSPSSSAVLKRACSLWKTVNFISFSSADLSWDINFSDAAIMFSLTTAVKIDKMAHEEMIMKIAITNLK